MRAGRERLAREFPYPPPPQNESGSGADPVGALGRTTRHLKAGFATLLLLTFATTFAPLAALAQTSVSLSIADATGAESAGPLSFTVTATPTPTSPVTFKYTVTKETGDTATAGVEFIAVTTATTASIAANASTTTITVSVVDDNILGSDRTFTVTLSEPSAGVTISDAVATGTITEDDEGSVTVSTAALTVAEGGSGNYTVKLDVQPTANVTVTVAGASGDVTVMGSPLTFTSINFSTAQTVTVNAGEDLDTATDPDVTLTHSASGGGYGSVSIASVVVSVTENDTPPSVGTPPAAPTGLTVTAGDSSATLSWSDPDDAGITGWQYRYKAGSGAWGAWTDIGSSGATTTSHTVSGLSNGTSYVFQIRAKNGNGNGASSGDSSSVTPKTVVRFTRAYEHPAESTTVCPRPEARVTEDGAREGRALTLEVTRTSRGVETLPVEFEIVSKSGATGSAADLSVGLTTLNSMAFSSGNVRRCYSLGIAKDLLVEPNEKLVLRIKPKSDYIVDSTKSEREITLEEGPNGGIRMVWREDATLTPGATTGADVRLEAGAPVGSVTGTVSNTNCSWQIDTTFNQRMTIPWRKASGSEATLADFDYPAAVTFVNGVATVTFKARNDADTEAETFRLEVSGPQLELDEGVGRRYCETQAVATANSLGNFFFFEGTISEPPAKSVKMPGNLSVNEDAGNATVTVTASPALGRQVTFNVSYSGTATGATNPANGDYDNDAVTQITFSASDTTKDIVIPITDDSVDDDDEYIDVSIALAPGSALPDGFVLSPATTRVSIRDNDNTSVSVPSTLSVTEGTDDDAVVRITATKAFGQSITFNITYGGTATGANNPANGDYDNDAVTSVTFNAADTTKDITIPITDDALDEGDETLTVTIASPDLLNLENFPLGNATTTVTIKDNDAPPSVSIADADAVTEGDSGATDMTFTVSLDAASGQSVTVDYAVAASSTATTNTDFTGGSGTLTFAAGETSQSITVSVTGDELDEEDETVVIELSNAGNATLGTSTATGTITDDDAPPALSVAAPDAVTEGDSGATDLIFTVSLGAASSREVTVDYAVDDDTSTAVAGSDFTELSGTLTFTAGQTSQPITVSVTGDELDEEDETVVIELSNAGNASIGTATATGTITDDDASPELATLAPVTVKLGQAVDITATATDGDGDTVTYAWTRDSTETTPALPGGTGLNQGRLTFTPPAIGVYTMTVTASDGNGNTDTGEVTITVGTADTLSAPSTLSVTEGTDNSATIAVTASAAFGGSGLTLSVTYNGGNSDTASGANNPADGDYDNDAVTQVVFDASETTKNIVIPITDDDLDEPAETFTVTMALAGGSALPAGFVPGNLTTTVTIGDDDESPVLDEIADRTVRVGQQVDITASATDGDGDPVTYEWTRETGETTPPLPQGTALNQARLAFTPPAPGVYTMTVTARDGNGNSDTQEVTITVVAASTVSAPSALQVTEGTHSHATVTVTASRAFGTSVTFEVSYRDGTATGANDAADGDYDNDAVTQVVFNASETTKDIAIPITDDDRSESVETFTVTIALADGSALPTGFVLGNATTTVTISDDDDSPVSPERDATVSAPSALQVTEGTHRHATVTVTASRAFGTSVTFEVIYRDGTATGANDAAAGDYDNDAVTQVVFGASDTTKDIVIPITDDDRNESAETFTVTIALADGSTLPDGFVLGNATTTVTIGDDDDSPELPELPERDATVSAPSALQVTEGTHSHATVTVTASQAFGTAVTFEVSYRDGTATGANDAANGDYDNDAVTQVVFNASETTKSIMIPITDDRLYEPAETFTVTIAASGGLPTGFALGNATTKVTIVDNDDHPGVTLSPVALEIAEGGSGSYTLVLDTQPSGEVMVTVGGATGEVTAQPASLSFTPANWSDPQSVTVESAHDDDALPDEAVRLTHSASGGGYDGVSIDPVTVTVVEDDEAAVTLSETELVIDEGAQGRYTVVLETQPVGGEVTVTPISAEPMALGVSGALRFGASDWNIAQTVTVTGVRDTDTEDATVRVSHTVSGGDYAGVTVASVTVTVTDQTLAGRLERANRINAEVLPQIAAATMSHTLSAVTERMEEAASCEARVGSLRLGALPSAPFEDPWGVRSHTEPASPSVSELLDGSSFTLPVGASGTDTASSTLSVWGRGERASLSGTERAVSWDGELWTAHLGADWCQRSDLVAGAALAYSESDLDAGVGDGAQVAHETKMTSLHPYAVWRLPDGSNLWGSVGYGSGEARISESEDGIHSAALTQDLSQWSVAMGGRRVLLEEESAVGVDRVALKGEGALARLDTAANDGLTSLAVKATRLRLLLEASHERVLANHATLTPSLEAGLRRDGGDLGSGLGLEAGASLLWRAPQTGWTGELRARALVAHERDRDEWGISARLRLDPASDGRGLSLSFGPEYGYTETEMEGLFDYDPVPVATDSAVEEDMEGRVQAEMGYGIGISRSGPMALLTPYAGFTLGRSGEETFRVGARYRLGEGLSVGIEGKHQTQAVGENSLMLRAVVRW